MFNILVSTIIALLLNQSTFAGSFEIRSGKLQIKDISLQSHLGKAFSLSNLVKLQNRDGIHGLPLSDFQGLISLGIPRGQTHLRSIGLKLRVFITRENKDQFFVLHYPTNRMHFDTTPRYFSTAGLPIEQWTDWTIWLPDFNPGATGSAESKIYFQHNQLTKSKAAGLFSNPNILLQRLQIIHHSPRPLGNILQDARSLYPSLFETPILGENYFGSVLSSDFYPGYRFFLLTPSKKVNRGLQEKLEGFNHFTMTFLVLCLILGIILNYLMTHPVALLQTGMKQIQNNELDFQLPAMGRDESAQVLKQFNQLVVEMSHRNAMMPFVSEAVLHLFKKFDEGADAISCNGAVVFSDIRSFTTISETYTADDIVEMLNGYFSIWQPTIEKYGGVIDRFIGDAISIVFLEEMHPDYKLRAVSAAAEVMKALQHFNQSRYATGRFTVKNGVGIAHSHVDLTIIGNNQKKDFFILGESTEVAENLEAESKRGVHSKIIVDEEIYRSTQQQFMYDDFDSEEYPTLRFYELVPDHDPFAEGLPEPKSDAISLSDAEVDELLGF